MYHQIEDQSDLPCQKGKAMEKTGQGRLPKIQPPIIYLDIRSVHHKKKLAPGREEAMKGGKKRHSHIELSGKIWKNLRKAGEEA